MRRVFRGPCYSLRTAILPFVFIFNPEILLINIEGWFHFFQVIVVALIAILLFSAATMNWFMTRSRLWESAVLLLVCFTLFRPDWWLNQFYPAAIERPASELLTRVEQAPADRRMAIVVEGLNLEGETVRKTVSVPLGDPKEPRLRLRTVGLGVAPAGDKVTITNVAFGSYAKRLGLEAGYEVVAILEPAPRPSTLWPIGFALAGAGLIALLQVRRRDAAAEATSPA